MVVTNGTGNSTLPDVRHDSNTPDGHLREKITETRRDGGHEVATHSRATWKLSDTVVIVKHRNHAAKVQADERHCYTPQQRSRPRKGVKRHGVMVEKRRRRSLAVGVLEEPVTIEDVD